MFTSSGITVKTSNRIQTVLSGGTDGKLDGWNIDNNSGIAAGQWLGHVCRM